ncbi:MAG TPA: ATP-binding protein [Candidatus Acidoferrales bacterium]|nr:ATP-binding protein [Candidatus Acidoferrales bacterium]
MLGAVAARLPRVPLPVARRRAPSASQLPAGVSVAREVLRFVAGVLIASLFIAGGSFWVVSQAATAQAIRTAEVVTELDAHSVVQPALTQGVVRGSPAAIAQLDSVVRNRVLNGRVVRVKIWTASGRILYSDLTTLIGETYPLGDDEQAAFAGGKTAADDSDLSKPENRFEQTFGRLLEVYLPVRAQGGTTLLFETYQNDAAIQADRSQVWNGLLPGLIAGVGVLFIVQIPLSWRLARRLERSGKDRAALLQRAIDSSETERRRVASDLHDGPVQNLTAVSLNLGSMATRLSQPSEEPIDRTQVAGVITTASNEARHAIRDLRSLIIEIAPPDLAAGGLVDALERLLVTAREGGIQTEVHFSDHIELSADATALVYRVTQESVRNVIKHAQASHLMVSLSHVADAVKLDVVDDGSGFTLEKLHQRRQEGHVGLALLEDRVAEAGAAIQIESDPGMGTRIHLQIDDV